MYHTANAIKRAEVMDEMPTSPNQQGLGFGIYLDRNNPNDGESLAAIEKSFPVSPKQRSLNKYIDLPYKNHMLAFEDLLEAGEPLDRIIKLLKEQNAEGLKEEMSEQFKRIPRPNN